MIYIKPSFYDDFKCTASKCSDSCCIGWEIDIDNDTMYKYDGVNGAFGDELRDNIIENDDGGNSFWLCVDERCPFLNKDNLCRVIMELGEEYLCNICREHPRFYEWFPGVTECGLGLCCEEACRLLLENEEPFSLCETNDGEKLELKNKEERAESDTYIFLSAFRESLFDCLWKKDFSFKEKCRSIRSKTQNFCNKDLILKSNEGLIYSYKKTEPIDEKWTLYINEVSRNLDKYLKIEKTFDDKTKGDMLYSKILAYIIYRHFIKAVFDGGISARIAFCLESVRFIKICDMKTFYEKGELTLKDRIDNLKNWSKQIEYSEENTEFLIYGE